MQNLKNDKLHENDEKPIQNCSDNGNNIDWRKLEQEKIRLLRSVRRWLIAIFAVLSVFVVVWFFLAVS